MQRLTEQQKKEAEERVEQARLLARRFRLPARMSSEEWEAEALMVLVEAIATRERNDNFEAHLCTRLRYRRLQINDRRPPMERIVADVPARQETPCDLQETLHGLRDADCDMLRLRVMGADWQTLGTTYGCSGRTVQRWFNRVADRLRKRVALER